MAADLLQQRIAALREELVRFLRRRTHEPEEIAQETLVRVARAAPRCPDEASFRAFAFVTARRLLIDAARRRARRVPLVPLEGGVREPTSPDRPDAELQAGQSLALVERELAQMKPAVAEVFRLRLTTDLSFDQIARQQGVSINTALGRHHQATKRIARALREAGLIAAEDP
ncbi:MAG: RNA polymerase sigma factor [Myxococcota bacterium]